MIYSAIKNGVMQSLPTLVIFGVALIAVRIAYLKNHHDTFRFYEEFWSLLSILYMILLYQMVTGVEDNVISGVNLIPFKEIMRYELNSELFYYNVVGNIALFIPFGYIIASYIKPKRVWTNMVLAIIVSTTTELVQLNIGRSFDIDDIILNTIGCIVGFLLYVGFKAICRHLPGFFKKNWFKNLICIIIGSCIVIYILNVMGIYA